MQFNRVVLVKYEKRLHFQIVPFTLQNVSKQMAENESVSNGNTTSTTTTTTTTTITTTKTKTNIYIYIHTTSIRCEGLEHRQSAVSPFAEF
jgi:hypothetical protein